MFCWVFLVGEDQLESNFTAQMFLNESSVVGVIYLNKTITGITVLGNELFITRRKTPNVTVYNNDNFTFTRQIPIPGSIDPLAIVAIPR